MVTPSVRMVVIRQAKVQRLILVVLIAMAFTILAFQTAKIWRLARVQHWHWCVLAACCVVNVGCALTQEVSKTPRNATEQLLLSEALDRALVDIDVPIPEGESVRVEVSGLQTDRMPLHLDEQSDRSGVVENPSWDLAFVRDMTTGRLGKLGYRVQISQDEARYLVRVLVQAMGTNQGKTFYGVPSIQSVVIPFSLPQITLYQKLEQLAHVRLHLDIFEAGTGWFLRSTSWTTGNTFYNQYTVLFFFSFRRTDLVAPP